jgi:Recombination endonuclease VII
MRDGHRNECKACWKVIQRRYYLQNREKAIASVQRWRNANPERYRAYRRRYLAEHGEEKKRRDREGHLKRKYGVTQNMFEALVAAQLGNCAICGANEDLSLHVDHDHTTKRVRGLLCGKCNKAIGLLNDDPALMLSAKGYLERARSLYSAQP